MATDHDPLLQKPHVYDDRFVNIDAETSTLTLKHYLLVKPTLKIHIPALLYIRPASEVVSRIGLKPQGLSLSGILWARDWHRGGAIIGPGSGYEKSFVIKVQGDKLRSGFSVEDPEKFLAGLERVYPGITKKIMDAQEETEIRSETEREAGVGGGVEGHPETHDL